MGHLRLYLSPKEQSPPPAYKPMGGFGILVEMYNEIKEKDVFWGFDQLVEKGYVNYDYEENEIRMSKIEHQKAIELGPEEMGRVLRQVIDTMGLKLVDLVLHDSAFGLRANWVSKNLSFKVIQTCCLASDSESHRILLKGRNGRKLVVGIGNKINSTFNIVEWIGIDGVKDIPMQVVWSEKWVEEGWQVSDILHQATLVTHFGGRWPQVTLSCLPYFTPKKDSYIIEQNEGSMLSIQFIIIYKTGRNHRLSASGVPPGRLYRWRKERSGENQRQTPTARTRR